MREAGRLQEAVGRLREAIAVEPNHAPALVNLGDALGANGELDEAEQVLDRAIQLAPALVEAHMTLGIVRLQRGRVPESVAALRTALTLSPSHADAHSNLAHALFVSGAWEAAWPHFEYRFRRHAYRGTLHVPAAMARWDGSLSHGLELWLVGEQGLGDQLQFARYAKLLRAEGVKCVITCEPRIVRILSASGIADHVVPFGTAASERRSEDSCPDGRECRVAAGTHARFIPLMSLPAWHRTRQDSVPAAAGYLVADDSRVGLWRERLSEVRGVRVALAWAGNPLMETGRYVGRSPPLSTLAPLMAVRNVGFISVQKYAGEDQLDSVQFGGSITRLPDLDSGPDAFLDTAAVLKCVDLLVTSDTSIAHLGGALGVPTWLCLAHEPDWRWMRSGSATPWYTSMRLFRQPAPGDWQSVFVEVASALDLYASARS
jgi:hypothetical protein